MPCALSVAGLSVVLSVTAGTAAAPGDQARGHQGAPGQSRRGAPSLGSTYAG